MHPFVARPLVLASLFAALSLVACGGVADTSGEARGKATPGGQCGTPGASLTAADGCNRCTCSERGTWACTEEACASDGGIPPSSCTPGAQRSEGDCNTCSCSSQGTWQCTRLACAVCTEGTSKAASDGCNTCTCSGGGWACTERACPVPVYDGGPAPECHQGDTKREDCNECSCENGGWLCTLAACNGCGGFSGLPCPEVDAGSPKGCGGWLGDTCSASEYCAYTIGQLCGAADASATCKPRPTGCTLEYAPVCGCDGNTYGNACAAAAAGTGVNASGQCPATFR